MPARHFYLLRHHILFYIKFLGFCSLAPDEIRILCKKYGNSPDVSIFLLNYIEISKEKGILQKVMAFRRIKFKRIDIQIAVY